MDTDNDNNKHKPLCGVQEINEQQQVPQEQQQQQAEQEPSQLLANAIVNATAVVKKKFVHYWL